MSQVANRNRITSAFKKLSLQNQNAMAWLTVNAGVRYEDVQLLNDFGNTTPTAIRRPHRGTIVLVPLYLVWEPVTSRGDLLLFFAGVHRGFARQVQSFFCTKIAPQYGAGVRVSYGTLHTEVIGFFNALH